MAVPGLYEFLTKRRSTQSADDAYQLDQQQPRTVATKQYELPKIDSSDVLGSLSGMLGPSPEERAAEEKRLQEHRQKMHGWTALFNGLRHLGNLYYAAKGAPGQKFSDPHQQIQQQYQDERKRLADIHAADRNYYANLWGLYRQVNDEQRRNTLAEAQAQYYGTRDEMARLKAENDRLKAEAAARNTDARTEYTQERTKTEQELRGGKQREIESRINRNNRTGTGGSGGRRSGNSMTTTYEYNEDGKVVKKNVTKGGSSQPGGGGKGRKKKVNW